MEERQMPYAAPAKQSLRMSKKQKTVFSNIFFQAVDQTFLISLVFTSKSLGFED